MSEQGQFDSMEETRKQVESANAGAAKSPANWRGLLVRSKGGRGSRMIAALAWLVCALVAISGMALLRGQEGLAVAERAVEILGAIATGFYVAKSGQRQAQIGKGGE